MELTDILGTTGTSSTSEQILNDPSQMGKDEFVTLLVTQLQNQDPFKPVDNTEFISQLAEFSALEQAEATAKNIELLTQYQSQTFQLISLTDGANLIGKEVTYFDPELNQHTSGKVESLDVVDGTVTLRIGGYVVPLGYVVQITDSGAE